MSDGLVPILRRAGRAAGRRRVTSAAVAVLALVVLPAAAVEKPRAASDAQVVAAYHYLLARAIVASQQQTELERDGVAWNQFAAVPPVDATAGSEGLVGTAPPPANLDLASRDAWIAVDESSCTLLVLPPIGARYYTAQVVDGWGETLANINQRTYPYHPAGTFALCLRGARPALPAGVQRIDLPSRTARLRVAIERGTAPGDAQRLLQEVTLQTSGAPAIPEPVCVTRDGTAALPGVELFDQAEGLLRGAPDVNPSMETPRAALRAVTAALTDPVQRARIATLIEQQAIPQFQSALLTFGVHGDGWVRPSPVGAYGADYLARSLVAFTDLWANTDAEVATFAALVDGAGASLDAPPIHTLTFPKDSWPRSRAQYSWSITALDAATGRLIDNPLDRHVLDAQSALQANPDGSLTLVFADQLPPDMPQDNWLPTRTAGRSILIFRFYGPSPVLRAGDYFPPPLLRR